MVLVVALGDRLGGVDDQVEEHLAEPRLVGVDPRHVGELGHEHRAVPDPRSQPAMRSVVSRTRRTSTERAPLVLGGARTS